MDNNSWITNEDISTNMFVVTASWVCFQFILPSTVKLLYSNKTFYKQLNRDDKADFCHKTIATIHAIISTVAALCVLASDEPSYEDALWGKSLKGEMVGAFTLGYMIADLVMVCRQRADGYMLVHHSIFVLFYPILLLNSCMTHLILIRVLAEISTPFVCMRWFLSLTGRASSKMYFYNAVLLLSTFFVSRILLMPYCYWRYFQTEGTAGYEKLGKIRLCFPTPVIMDCLNVYWFYRIVSGFAKYLRSHSKNK